MSKFKQCPCSLQYYFMNGWSDKKAIRDLNRVKVIVGSINLVYDFGVEEKRF